MHAKIHICTTYASDPDKSDPDKYSAAFAQSASADILQNAWGKRGNYPRTQVCQHPRDPGAWVFRPARYPDTSRSRHLSCRLARIWPPPLNICVYIFIHMNLSA